MSNVLAIAATTATLRNLLLAQVPELDGDLADLEVTVQAPDVARKGITKAQLNVFLYQTTVNAAWRNMAMPQQSRPGEAGSPPLALNLHYLMTAYGRGESDNDVVNHRVLGGAMSVLHDRPLLSRSDIAAALADNDLGQQFERLKITPLSLSVEEISKLWMVFQTQYRVSVAYEVTVVLIDPSKPGAAPLPVLKRGGEDRGVATVPGSAPLLKSLRLPRSQPALRLGEAGSVVGEHLVTGGAELRFTSTRLIEPVVLPPSPSTHAGEVTFQIPDLAADADAFSRWVPGLYSVAMVVSSADLPTLVSNEITFALAPRVTVSSTSTGPGAVDVEVTCAPRLGREQRVSLLLGDRPFAPKLVVTPASTSQPTTLSFEVGGLDPGSYVARLRVDGVDSIPVVYSGTPPLAEFDPTQKVTVT